MNWFKNKLDNLQIDFVRPRWIFASISGVLVLASWFLFFVAPGPQWGIDFQGGTEIHLKFNAEKEVTSKGVETGVINKLEGPAVDVDQIRDALKELKFEDDVVQRVGLPEEQEYQIRIKDTTAGSEELQAEVMKRLAEKYGAEALGEPTAEAEVGTRMEIPFTDGEPPPVAEIKTVLDPIGDGIIVAESKEIGQVSVRLPGAADLIIVGLQDKLTAPDAAGNLVPVPMVVLATDSVGPKVGGDLANQGFIAIMITLALVLVYIAFRFDIGFAPGAVLALLHDVSLTAGVFVLIGLEINLAIVGALLTIVGYSLNDTIVIYDRIRENQERYRRKDMPDLINVSINETMARTLATSVTTFLAILPFIVFGGEFLQTIIPGMPSAGDVIWSFAFAMLLGIVFGTYSTIYVASPTILVMEDVKPWLMKLIPDMGLSASDDEVEGAETAALTASEQRRRERRDKSARGEV